MAAIQAWDTPQINREMEGVAPNAELNELNGGNMLAICHTKIIIRFKGIKFGIAHPGVSRFG